MPLPRMQITIRFLRRADTSNDAVSPTASFADQQKVTNCYKVNDRRDRQGEARNGRKNRKPREASRSASTRHKRTSSRLPRTRRHENSRRYPTRHGRASRSPLVAAKSAQAVASLAETRRKRPILRPRTKQPCPVSSSR